MIIQFIKYNTKEHYCEEVVSRIKVSKRNRDLLTVMKDNSFIDILGRTYLILHTSLTIAIKNTGLNTDVFNVYITDKAEEFENFFPTFYYPGDTTVKECKDYLVRSLQELGL